ncbi:MAG: hypothetical protein GPJ54_11665 [Candidatus Heimdallarchaeota archaeon]|nr:hypothetical protein [Candidatus Heimdallarchaeota archaeon]
MRLRIQVILVLFILSSFLTQVSAQEMSSDPEAADLKARVISVTSELKNASFSYSANDSNLELTITLEVWNPYNEDVTSYGSSSCRWTTQTESHIDGDHSIEDQGNICTSDWAPRFFPSGSSSESSLNHIIFVNEDINKIPDGFILVNGQGGTYENTTDNFYGAKIIITSGEISIEYEEYPDDWGQILFTKPVLLDFDFFPFLTIFALLGYVGRKYQFRK